MSVDEQQNALLRNSQQDIVSNPDVEVRNIFPAPVQRSTNWSRGLLYGGVSILVAMLIAGQVVSVMFLLKQQDKITTLQKTTDRIESKYPRGNPVKPKPIMHLRPMMMDLPIAYIDPKAEAPKPRATTPPPLTPEEQVQQLLKEGNKTVEIPELKGSFSSNLKLLKESMNESAWEDFESWLQNWLLFQLVQNEKKTEPTSAPQIQPRRDPQPSERKAFSSIAMRPMLQVLPIAADTSEKSKMPALVSAKKDIMAETECEKQRMEAKIIPGTFRPSCDEDGNFEAKQCWPSTGYCWCTYPNGTEIEGTATRLRLDSCETFNA